jgi:hypothetical protein
MAKVRTVTKEEIWRYLNKPKIYSELVEDIERCNSVKRGMDYFLSNRIFDPDSFAEVALSVFIDSGNIKVVKWLLQNGTRIREDFLDSVVLRSAYGDTLNQEEIAKLLLQYGANPNSINQVADFSTALGIGLGLRAFGCVKSLLEYGADPNMLSSGNLPIAIAATQDQSAEHMRRYEHYRRNSFENRVPDSIVIEKEKYNYIKLLLQYGAEVVIEAEVLKTRGERYSIIPETQSFLAVAKVAKDMLKAFLDADAGLCPEMKILVEKFATRLIFSADKEPDVFSSEDCVRDSIAKATEEVTPIYQQIAGYNQDTKDFILVNVQFIDHSLGRDFKHWNLSKLDPKKAVVNLIYVCGDKVSFHYIESLPWIKMQKFIKFIPQDEAGNVLPYSAEGFELAAICRQPVAKLINSIEVEGGACRGAFKKIMEFAGAGCISLQSADSTETISAAAQLDTTLAGDIPSGPATEEA